MKPKSLSQRRSLAAKRGWETRRNLKAMERINKMIAANEAASKPPPENWPRIDYDINRSADILYSIDRAHREREAQSKHPGSPEHVSSLQPEAGLSHPPSPATQDANELPGFKPWAVGDEAFFWGTDHKGEMTKGTVIAAIDLPGYNHAHYIISVPNEIEASLVIRSGFILEMRKTPPCDPPEMGAESEARSELLLTEGMRVKETESAGCFTLTRPRPPTFSARIRDLIDRFVKRLGA